MCLPSLRSIAFGAALLRIGVLHAQASPPAATPTRVIPKSTAAIASDATPATVTIIALGATGDTLGQGSGFIVRSDGTILTNWHVLQGASRAIVILATRESFERVSFVDGDSAADLAIVRIPGFRLPVLPTRSTTPAVGERVVAIGSPLGLSHTVTEGIVSAIRTVDGRQLVQISASISPGSSGGAVLDAAGRVFAVSTSFLEGGQQINFAVPVRYALGLLATPLRERTLADVFATGRRLSDVRPGATGRPPPRTARVRPSISGAFRTDQEWTAGDGSKFPLVGLLLVDQAIDFVGLAIRPYGDSGEDFVEPVFALRSDESGQVMLDLDGIVYDGYQTDEGFFVERHGTRPGGMEFSTRITATPTSIKLSEPNGLYRIGVRTNSFADRIVGEPVDWQGRAAIVVYRDSIWVRMALSNARGGTSGMYSQGSISNDGWFDVLSADGTKRLTGRVRAGALEADWVDNREQGVRFQGRIQGERY